MVDRQGKRQGTEMRFTEASAPDLEVPAARRAGTARGIRWRWVFPVGLGVAALPYLLLYPLTFAYVFFNHLLGREGRPEQFGYVIGAWGMPLAHAVLTLLATYWVVRRAGARGAAARYGLSIALLSVAASQVFGMYYEAALDTAEVAKYLALALAGGMLGGAAGRNSLAGQESLYHVSRDIGAARSPQAIVAAVADHLAGPGTGVALLQAGPVEGEAGTSGTWIPRYSRDWPEGASFGGIDPAALSGPGGEPWRVLRVRDLPAPEQASWRSRGLRSALLVPLVAPDGARVGLLAVSSRSGRFSRAAVRRYLTAGAQAALVLENLRLVEEAERAGRQAGVMRERQRMAHEIHDTLAQGFTSIVTNLEAADSLLPPEVEEVRCYLDHARTTARESLTEARRLVWDLRPEPLEGSALPQALAGLAGRWSRTCGLAADFSVTGTPRSLPVQVEASLFRVAQEALQNIHKHARASRAALTLSYMGDAVVMDAVDDGVGFDPPVAPAGPSGGGFGLKGMRERIEQVGGTLSVESAPGEGTTLAAEVPLAVAGRGLQSPEKVETP
jgi:signal transduction histidine kinase